MKNFLESPNLQHHFSKIILHTVKIVQSLYWYYVVYLRCYSIVCPPFQLVLYFIFTEKFSASIERLSCSWTNRELQTEVYDRRILYSYTILLQTYRFCPHWPLLRNAEIPPTISKFNGHLLLRFLMIQLNITSSKEMICRHRTPLCLFVCFLDF